MVVDIGVVRNYIKPKADSTLYNMRKVDLIEYIRTLEHNYNVAVSFNENQAKYIESLGFKEVVRCKDCKHCVVTADGMVCECALPTKRMQDYYIYGSTILAKVEPDAFCSHGERREGE